MRSVLTLVAVLAGGAAVGEDLPGITLPPRYGVVPSPEFYPQGTAKEALATAAKLMEKQRYAYLLAHVVDPDFVDAKVGERVQQLETAVEKRLAAVREEQKRGLPADTTPDRVIPTDPAGFAAKVRAEATKQAFADLVQAVQDNLSEFPEQVKELTALSQGSVGESPPTAFAEAKGVPGKKVFLKQLAVAATKEAKEYDARNIATTVQQPVTVQRWFLEDRQHDAEPKKDK